MIFLDKLASRVSGGVKVQTTRLSVCGSVRRFARVGRKMPSITVNCSVLLLLVYVCIYGVVHA
jgi:hypothetical protein